MSLNGAVKPTENQVELLEWDSSHFEFLVGCLLDQNISDQELTIGLASARRANYRLVYWSTRLERTVSDRLLAEFGGRLVDQRAVYEVTRLVAPPMEQLDELASDVRMLSLAPGPASPRLVALGIVAGANSRFRLDDRITREQLERLYETWVQRSSSRELADEVLIAVSREGREIGFVTIKVRDRTGQIGLIAVEEEARGRGVGSQLLTAAHRWMATNGAERARVVTQLSNEAACRLYARMGYHLSEVTAIYHFWPLEKSSRSRGSCAR